MRLVFRLGVVLLAVNALALAARASPLHQDPSPDAEAFVCPMHLEIRTSKPGTCPRCGMALVPAAPAVPADFELKMESTPRILKPGQKTRLRFTVINPVTGEQARQFGVLHDKLFHLFLVSQDLTQFQHIHPTLEADGRFVIDTVLPRAGHYKVYADLYPLEGAPQVLQRSLVTAGAPSDLYASMPHLEPDVELAKTVDGMRIELTLDPPQPIAGRPVLLKYRLTDAASGAPGRALTPDRSHPRGARGRDPARRPRRDVRGAGAEARGLSDLVSVPARRPRRVGLDDGLVHDPGAPARRALTANGEV